MMLPNQLEYGKFIKYKLSLNIMQQPLQTTTYLLGLEGYGILYSLKNTLQTSTTYRRFE